MSMRYRVSLDAPEVKSFRRVGYSPGPRRVALALLVFFLLSTIALAFLPWQQTAYGEGQVIAYSPTDRPQSIQAPVGGRLGEWFVREGSRVAAGDPIVRIEDVDPELLVRLRTERDAAEAAVQAATAAVQTARRNVRRQADLVEEGLSARRQLEEAQLKEADALKSLASARAELAKVQTRLARQDVQQVEAPSAGVIVRILEGQGGLFVKPGDALATLVPHVAQQSVELWIDGNELPLVQVGGEVRLQFEGWPALQFSGWPAVAMGTFGGRVQVIDAAQTDRPGKFRVLVRPGPDDRWPSTDRLLQGVQAHGWILLGQVPLGYELWRRFNDFPPQPAPERKGDTQGKDGSPDSAEK